MGPLRFHPIYQERIWGGRAFERFGRSCIPPRGNLGESWEICDRHDANSRVKNGPLAGYTLRELLRSQPEEIMGAGWHPERRFPILVKWLDSRERLSLQVHPPRAVTDIYGGDPKTETWYVAHAEPHAGLYCGLKRGVTREIFEAELRKNKVSDLVHRVAVKDGDVLHTPSGRLHAIDAGCLILEIQQNSDTTYRVYDWGRPRALHIDESLRCIDFGDFEPEPLRATEESRTLTENEHYRLRVMHLAGGELVSLPAGKPAILSVVHGSLTEIRSGEDMVAGDNLLISAAFAQTLRANGKATMLITDRFC